MPENVVHNILGREADLGVLSFEIINPSLETQEFFNDSISLIVSTNHPWAYRRSIEPSELLEEPLIIREPTSGTRRVLLEELAKHDISIDDLNIFLEVGNAEAIVRTVAEGYGIAFVSTLAIQCPLERGSVAEIPVTGLKLMRKIYMVRKSLDTPRRPKETFWSFMYVPESWTRFTCPNESRYSLEAKKPEMMLARNSLR
jgi:DNA-binding transcriptional LysR family regulator